MTGAAHDDSFASFADLAQQLSALRTSYGSPSYDEIRRRIGVERAARGRGRTPGRVTVYDCFRPDRSRIDLDLLRDIVLAVTADAAQADLWRRRALTLTGRPRAERVVASVLPPGPAAAAHTLPEPDTVTLITGLPGVGKSTLARELAERARAAGAVDHVVRVEARGYHASLAPAGPLDLLRAVAGALEVRGAARADLDTLLTAVRDASRTRPTAVIVEDVRAAGMIAGVLAHGPRWIVTSRSRMPELPSLLAAHAEPLEVRSHEIAPLDEVATARVLQEAWPVPVDAAALHRLVRASGGIRLCIDLMVRFAVDHPDWAPDDVAHRFASGGADMIHSLLDTMYRTLPADQARVLRSLSIVGVAVPIGIVRAALGDDAAALDPVCALHLATVDAGLIRVHDAVAAFARPRADADDPLSARRAFASRLADAVVAATLDEAERGVLPRVHAELCVAAATAADEVGAADAVVRLALELAPVLDEAGRWSELVAVLERADPAAAPDQRAVVAEHLARAYELLGRLDESLAALHRARRAGGERMPGRLWNVIGNLHRHLGRFDQAHAAYRDAAATAHAAANGTTEGRAIGNSANLARITGDLRTSERLFDEAEALSLRMGDEVNLAILRGNRVYLDLALGRSERALATTAQLVADPPAALSALGMRALRATALLSVGDRDGALALLADVDASDNDPFETPVDALAVRAHIHCARGDLDAAEHDALRALEGAQAVDVALPVPDALNTLARVALARGDLDGCRALAARARDAATTLGDPQEQARAHETLADAAAAADDETTAFGELTAAASILDGMGHVRFATLAQRVRELSP